jgi:hypothetical protein
MAEQIDTWPISGRTISALRAANYLTLSDLPEFLDDLKAIKGLGAKGLSEIREWCSTKFGRVFKSRPKEKKKVLDNYKASRKVVEHFLGKETNWPKQLKIADALIKKYSEEILLLVTPRQGVFSLAWYNTGYGDAYIRKYIPVKVVQKEEEKEEVDETPCDLEIQFVKKPSIKDLLK